MAMPLATMAVEVNLIRSIQQCLETYKVEIGVPPSWVHLVWFYLKLLVSKTKKHRDALFKNINIHI